MRNIVLFLILGCAVTWLPAQDTRNAEVRRPPRPQYQAAKKEKKSIFGFLKKEKKNELKTSQEELVAFRNRVSDAYAENARVERKIYKRTKKEAKKGKKFHGHKRPPKKRPPGKQKFCKICRIKH